MIISIQNTRTNKNVYVELDDDNIQWNMIQNLMEFGAFSEDIKIEEVETVIWY